MRREEVMTFTMQGFVCQSLGFFSEKFPEKNLVFVKLFKQSGVTSHVFPR
jgi:hypothetical protein